MKLVLPVLLVLCVAALALKPVIPRSYPLYMQCDKRWGSHLMGGNNPNYDTICIQGCAMSSTSMALAGYGYQVWGNTSMNPGSLNDWLRVNKGYKCFGQNCNNLVLNAPDGLAPRGQITFLSEDQKPDYSVLKSYLAKQSPVAIGHVRNKSHFVLLTGYDQEDDSIIYCNDPFFQNKFYYYSNISDILLYDIKPAH